MRSTLHTKLLLPVSHVSVAIRRILVLDTKLSKASFSAHTSSDIKVTAPLPCKEAVWETGGGG